MVESTSADQWRNRSDKRQVSQVGSGTEALITDHANRMDLPSVESTGSIERSNLGGDISKGNVDAASAVRKESYMQRLARTLSSNR